jgi:hypothetical protein
MTTDTWLVAGLPSRRPGFLPRPVHVRFMVDRVVVEEVFLRALLFYPASIIIVLFHTHLSICLLLTLYNLSN